jgi:prepilin-type N-terminal cleavage/methylation domain-containing protein
MPNDETRMKLEIRNPKSERSPLLGSRSGSVAALQPPVVIRHSSFVISRGGFTLAEVLAAMLLMAIVLPVAVQGLRIASRAGVVSERKALIVRLAESKLNELVVTGQWQASSPKGTIQEGRQSYPWQLLSEPWMEDGAMRLLTVQVTVPVQGEEYAVRVSTLVDATQ